MHSIFRPKHQKLILQCYPSTKLSTAETKPNQAELSYLVFYASSRRTKLEKVGDFLLKKTAADIIHKRVGHLKVTLYILQELISKCSEDLGFMTPYVVNIIKDIVLMGDLSTCQLACSVFVTYCEILQPIQRQVFTSNVSLLNNFLNIIVNFLNFSSVNNSQDWLRISLKITLVVADYIDPSFSQFEKFDLIGKSINLLLSTITTNQTDLSLIRISSSNSTNEKKLKDDASIDQIATHVLKSFFDTNSKNQLDIATKNVFSYLIQNGKDLNWANRIVIICSKKTHIELRHRIMIIISNIINKYVKENKIDILDYILKIESNLLNSDDVQFVGLPIIDILDKLIEFELKMILNNESHVLKDSYSDVIRSLTSRIYYNNQINDMIIGILSNYNNEYFNNQKLNEENFFHFSEIIIDNIHDILIIGDKPTIKMKKSDYPLSLFNYLYLTLPLDNFPKIRQQVQIMWLKLLNEFYKIPNENFSIPNIELCITNNVDNNLCLFFESMDKILKNNPRDEIKAQMSITISTMVKSFKINFLINYLKFVLIWLKDEKDFKYSLSLLLLGISSLQLKDGHQLAVLIDSKIAYSQNEKIWPDYISYQATSKPSGNVLTVNELIDVLNNIPSINKWMKKININQPIPAFTNQHLKTQNSVLLMSASNSELSLPLNKSNTFNNSSITRNLKIQNPHMSLPESVRSTIDSNIEDNNNNNNNNNSRYSMNDSNSSYDNNNNDDDGDTFSDAVNYSTVSDEPGSLYMAPTMYSNNNNNNNNNGGRSIRSGWSTRTGRSNRVNLKELMQTKSDAINEVDLARLVKTRTGATLSNVNTNVTFSNGNNNNNNNNSNNNNSVNVKNGLAFALSGLNLDES